MNVATERVQLDGQSLARAKSLTRCGLSEFGRNTLVLGLTGIPVLERSCYTLGHGQRELLQGAAPQNHGHQTWTVRGKSPP